MSASLDVGHVNSKRFTIGEGTSRMEGEERELPEELVERIIARMPFPSLFKARVLSKRWCSKFPSASQPGSSEASTFQSQVSANSASWPTYAPVFFNSSRMSLLAFDKAKSQRFALLSTDWPKLTGHKVWHAGALFLGECESVLIVTNVLTGSYRQLTVPSHSGFGKYRSASLLTIIAGNCLAYKVLAVNYAHVGNNPCRIDALCVDLYDSSSRLWTSTLSKFRDHPLLDGFGLLESKHCAYLEGKLYFLASYQQHRQPGWSLKLGSYDLEDSTWRTVGGGFDDNRYRDNSGVFLCGDKIIVVITSIGAKFFKEDETVEMWDRTSHTEGVEAVGNGPVAYIRENSILVFQLDVQSLELALISQGPPETVVIAENSKFSGDPRLFLSSDAKFVYFNCGCVPGSVVNCDLTTGLWSSVSLGSSNPNLNRDMDEFIWSPGTLEPGLNPFVSA